MKKMILVVLMAVLMVGAVMIAGCSDDSQVAERATTTQADNGDQTIATTTTQEETQAEIVLNDMTAEEIAHILYLAGFPLENVFVYDENNDPNELLGRPNQYTSKINAADTRLEQIDSDNPTGISIEVFENNENARNRKEYIDAIGEEMPMFVEYSFIEESVLLRVNKSLSPSQAQQYENALSEMSNGNIPTSIMEDELAEDDEEELNNIDNSRTKPAGLNEIFTVLKDDWMSGKVSYEIEMVDIVSGEEAWDIVQEANQFNDEPKDGMEYVLVKFRFKIIETEEDEPYSLWIETSFDAISEAGVQYTDFVSVSGLEPSLDNDLYAGAEHAGWTAFMVNEGDNAVVAVDRTTNAEIWFDLRAAN